MGRSSTAYDRLLDAACALIRTRGFGAVGVADICVQADVRKGSFYHFFASKQALTLAVIDSHWQTQRESWLAALGAPEPALQRLRRLFQDTVTELRATKTADGAVNGCLFANLALELSTQDQIVQMKLQAIFHEQIALIESTLHDAVREGSIPAASATTPIARAVAAQMEGMILFAKLGNDLDLLADLWPQTLLLLRAPNLTPAQS